MRMFAGPNGSGKSTLNRVLPPELLGFYINPDEIEKEIRNCGFFDSRVYGEESSIDALAFFQNSSFLEAAGLSASATELFVTEGRLSFQNVEVNSYFASVAAEFLRQRFLGRKISFTFETVMSSPDKVTLLEKAHHLGYRTYLYYIATEDPEINISRVRSRVQRGGHSVPEEKIVSRYWRSLNLLLGAIRHTNRAYIFDNSSPEKEHTWVAEITDGQVLELKADVVPAWFKRHVLDKLDSRSL
jgi:predicted ABC-type ATPase